MTSRIAAREDESMKLPISLVVVTKNEALNIQRCLSSAQNLVAEMLVIDSGSQDATCNLAEQMGARVLVHPWQGFGPQKAYGARQAQYDWILSLDADEALSPELVDELKRQFASLDPQVGYDFARKSFHFKRWIRHGGWYPDRQLRLFHRKHSMWNEAPIHEKVECQSRQGFQNPILHWVFRDLAHQIETNNRYSSLQAEELFAKGSRFSYLKFIFKPFSKFIECYFLKLGFLDGKPGFIIAMGAAYSVFLRWSKLGEFESKQLEKHKGN